MNGSPWATWPVMVTSGVTVLLIAGIAKRGGRELWKWLVGIQVTSQEKVAKDSSRELREILGAIVVVAVLIVYVAFAPVVHEGLTGRFYIFIKLVLGFFFLVLGAEIVTSHIMSMTWGRLISKKKESPYPKLERFAKSLGFLLGLSMLASAVQLFVDVEIP